MAIPEYEHLKPKDKIMQKPSLRTALKNGEFIAAPGIQDMITAVICNKIGFDFVYASGYWGTASSLGLPDAGIASYTQMLDRVTTLSRVANAGVIADADTGYGGLLNVHHTVRGYEDGGAAAVQLEDQEFPKKCGHTKNKRVILLEDMVKKFRSPAKPGKIQKPLLSPVQMPKILKDMKPRLPADKPMARLALMSFLSKPYIQKRKCATPVRELIIP